MRAVLERDFVATASRGRAFILRSFVAVAVAVTAWLVLLEFRHLFVDRPDEAARWVFAGGAAALLALLFVLTPPSVVGSILAEREQGTLHLVLASPVGPRELAAAKLLSRSLALLTWALAAVVPLAMTTLLGGVSLGQVADLAMLSVGLVIELSAWGVWVSSVTARLATGAVLAYVFPVLRWILFLAPIALFAGDDSPWEDSLGHPLLRAAAWTLGETTPALGIARMVDAADYDREVVQRIQPPPSPGGVWRFSGPLGNRNLVWTSRITPPAPPTPPRHLTHPAAVYLLCSLLGAYLAVTLAGRRLKSEAEPRRWVFDWILKRRRRLRSAPGIGNPMAWKEQSLLNTAASRPLYYTVLTLFVVAELFFLIGCSTFLRYEREMIETGLALVVGHAALLGLVAVVAGAGAMAHERSVGALDLLRASPLTPRDIVRGKFLGLLRGLGLLLLLPLAHLGFLVAGRMVDLTTVTAAACLHALWIVFFSMVGIVSGLSVLRLGAAVVRGAMVYGFLLIGVPLLAALFAVGFGQKRLAEAVMAGCPPATTYLVLEGSLRRNSPNWWAIRGYRDARPLEREHRLALAWTAFFGTVGVVAWGAAPMLLERRFDREREDG